MSSKSSQSLLRCNLWDPVMKMRGTSTSKRELWVKTVVFLKIMTYWYLYRFDPTGLILTKAIKLASPHLYYYEPIVIT